MDEEVPTCVGSSVWALNAKTPCEFDSDHLLNNAARDRVLFNRLQLPLDPFVPLSHLCFYFYFYYRFKKIGSQNIDYHVAYFNVHYLAFSSYFGRSLANSSAISATQQQ